MKYLLKDMHSNKFGSSVTILQLNLASMLYLSYKHMTDYRLLPVSWRDGVLTVEWLTTCRIKKMYNFIKTTYLYILTFLVEF